MVFPDKHPDLGLIGAEQAVQRRLLLALVDLHKLDARSQETEIPATASRERQDGRIDMVFGVQFCRQRRA